jgi:hypothetical protein
MTAAEMMLNEVREIHDLLRANMRKERLDSVSLDTFWS